MREDVLVRIGATSKGLDTALARTTRTVTDARTRIGRSVRALEAEIGRRMAGAARSVLSFRNALIAMAGVTGLAFAVKRAVEFADEIGKTARAIGVSAEALQEYRFAAGRAGIETAAFDAAMSGFSKRVGEARNGTGTLVTLLKALDPALLANIQRANNVEEAFDLVVDAAAAMSNELDRNALLAAAFGRTAGVDMANLIQGGTAAIDRLRERARELGIVLSDDVVRRAEQAAGELGDMGNVLQVAGASIALEFMPVITELARIMPDRGMIGGTREFALAIRDLVQWSTENADTLIRVMGALTGFMLGSRLGAPGAVSGTLAGGFAPEILGLFDITIQSLDERIAALEARKREIEGLIEAMVDMPFQEFLHLDPALFNEFVPPETRDEVHALLVELRNLDDQLKALSGSAGDAGDALGTMTGGTDGGEDPDDEIDDVAAAIANATLQADIAEGRFGRWEEGVVELATSLGLLRRETDAAGNEILVMGAGLVALNEQMARLRRAREAARIIEQTRTAAERYNEELVLLNELLEAGALNQEQFGRAVEQARERLERATEATEELGDRAAETDGIARDLGLTFESAFEDAVLEGQNLSDVLRQIEQDLLRLFIRRKVTEPLLEGFDDLIGGGDGLDLGSLLASAASGLFGTGPTAPPRGRALGGHVSAGEPVIVGERRPELFVPDIAGTIVPRLPAADAQTPTSIDRSVHVAMHVTGVSDAESFRRSEAQIMARLGNAVARAQRRNG